MNILQLCRSPALGGLELHCKDFLNWLQSLNDQETNVFFAARADTHLAHQAQPDLLFPQQDALWRSIWRLKQFIEAKQIHRVHIHDKKDLLLVVLTKKVSRHPFAVIQTRHMMLFGQRKDPYHFWLYRQLDALIAVTQQLAQQARDNLSIQHRKIHQIYLGTQQHTVIADSELGKLNQQLPNHASDPNPVTILVVARLCEEKSQHLVVDAAVHLATQNIHFRSLFVGASMDQHYSQRLIQLIEKHHLNAHLLGHRSDIPALLQLADIVILPTKDETFGLALIESMACKTCVIGADSGGIREIIDHQQTGLLFKAGDAKHLAEQIQQLIQRPNLRKQLAHSGQQKALKQFDHTAQNQKLLDLLMSPIDQKET